MTTPTEVAAARASLDAHLAADPNAQVCSFDAPCGCGRPAVWTSTTTPRQSVGTRTRTVPACVCVPVGIDDWSAR